MKFPFLKKGNNEVKKEGDILPVASRRDFLRKGVAGAIALATPFAYDVFKDPAFREKVFSEISAYFGEKAMEAKLEEERKLFFDIYGIELDLKSIGETNKEVTEKNDIEASRLALVQKIASEVYVRALNAHKESKGASIETITEVQAKMLEKVASDYYKENPYYLADESQFSSALSNFEKLQFIECLKDVFSLYPVEYIRKLKIKTINSGRDKMELSKTSNMMWPAADGGRAARENKNNTLVSTMYLDFSPSDYVSLASKKHEISVNISHEIAHMKDFVQTNDDLNILRKRWTEFSVEHGSDPYIGEYWKQLKERPQGFFRSYGASHPDEDRAIISEALWFEGQALADLCKEDVILKAKVDAIKKEYFEMDSRFTEEYFKMLRERKLDEVRQYVKYTVATK